jgi:branched-chain amino acid transport system substrate-binding protein
MSKAALSRRVVARLDTARGPRLVVVAGVVAGSLLALAGVASGSATSRSQQAAGTVTIGFITDLAGIYQTIGFPAYNGTMVAVNQVNHAGGITVGGKKYLVKLDTCEANSTSADAVACAQHLVRDDHVSFLMGGTGAESLPIASITDPAGVIYMNPGTALAQQLSTFKYAYNPLAGINLKVKLAAKALVRTFPHAKRVAFVTANDPTSAVLPLLEQQLAAYGVTVVDKETYDVNALDVTPQLTNAKAAKPDLLFVGWTQAEAAPVMKANQTIQVAPKIYGWTGGGSCQLFQKELGTAQFVSDLLIGSELSAPVTPAAKAYVNAYTKFVNTSSAAAKNPVNVQNIDYSAFYIDAIPLLAKAMTSARTTTNLSKIEAALMKVSISGVASPNYKFASDRSAVIAQAQCSVNIKGPNVISNFVIKP